MNIQIKDFNTGWFGITVGIKKSEVHILIEGLRGLQQDTDQHFHIRSEFLGEGGVGDIEFYVEVEEATDNSTIEIGPAIDTTR